MHLVDEQHIVSLVTIDGRTIEVGAASLNDDGDQLSALRDRVANEAGRHFSGDNSNIVSAAFDRAFEQVESTPGNSVEATVDFPLGAIVVARRLKAA